MTKTINLNADLGESFGAWKMGEDEALLQVVRSANIACGFHAGDPLVMRHTVRSTTRPARTLCWPTRWRVQSRPSTPG